MFNNIVSFHLKSDNEHVDLSFHYTEQIPLCDFTLLRVGNLMWPIVSCVTL